MIRVRVLLVLHGSMGTGSFLDVYDVEESFRNKGWSHVLIVNVRHVHICINIIRECLISDLLNASNMY